MSLYLPPLPNPCPISPPPPTSRGTPLFWNHAFHGHFCPIMFAAIPRPCPLPTLFARCLCLSPCGGWTRGGEVGEGGGSVNDAEAPQVCAPNSPTLGNRFSRTFDYDDTNPGFIPFPLSRKDGVRRPPNSPPMYPSCSSRPLAPPPATLWATAAMEDTRRGVAPSHFSSGADADPLADRPAYFHCPRFPVFPRLSPTSKSLASP